MPVELFVQDRPLPSVPHKLVPHLSRSLQAAGHRVRWQPEHNSLLVESPLEGRLIACERRGAPSGLADRLYSGLTQRVHMAGGTLLPGRDRRADFTLVLRAKPCQPGEEARILLHSRPPGWFTRLRHVPEAVRAKLREAMPKDRIRIDLAYQGSLGRSELHIDISAPDSDHWCHQLVRALWLALMSIFSTGRALGPTVEAAVEQAAEHRPADVRSPHPQNRDGGRKSAGMTVRDTSAGKRPAREEPARQTRRIIWQSEGPELPLAFPPAARLHMPVSVGRPLVADRHVRSASHGSSEIQPGERGLREERSVRPSGLGDSPLRPSRPPSAPQTGGVSPSPPAAHSAAPSGVTSAACRFRRISRTRFRRPG